MSKQTATDYLIQEIKNDTFIHSKSTKEWNEVFKKAKQMEREQIIDAYYEGKEYGFKEQGEQYYNETFEQTMSEYKKFIVYPSLFYKLGAEWAINEIKGGQDNE